MVEVGGRPMLWHTTSIDAARGFREFVVALGYRGEYTKNCYPDFHHSRKNLSVRLRTGGVDAHEGDHEAGRSTGWTPNRSGSTRSAGGRRR